MSIFFLTLPSWPGLPMPMPMAKAFAVAGSASRTRGTREGTSLPLGCLVLPDLTVGDTSSPSSSPSSSSSSAWTILGLWRRDEDWGEFQKDESAKEEGVEDEETVRAGVGAWLDAADWAAGVAGASDLSFFVIDLEVVVVARAAAGTGGTGGTGNVGIMKADPMSLKTWLVVVPTLACPGRLGFSLLSPSSPLLVTDDADDDDEADEESEAEAVPSAASCAAVMSCDSVILRFSVCVCFAGAEGGGVGTASDLA